MGMECYYSTYDESTVKRSLDIAKSMDLIPSGGSDFHGSNKPDIELGKGKGRLCVPYELLVRLRSEKN